MSDKMNREIMVVNNEKLFEWIKRETKIYVNDDINFEEKIVKIYEYMVRGEAEQNFNYKQPLPYGIVINNDNKIFVYKRWWNWSNNGEARLHSKISIWVGWHIEKSDEWLTDILRDTLKREIEEEINIKEEDINSVNILWYINIDDWEVQELHLWLAYLVRVNNSDIKLLDWELDNWEFVSLSTLEWMIISWDYDVEPWSKIIFEPLKKYLKK